MNSDSIHWDVLQPQGIEKLDCEPFGMATEFVFAVLKKHNIEVSTKDKLTDTLVLNFPAGTTWTENIPRIHLSRYTIDVPDGFSLHAAGVYGAKGNVRYALSIPLDSLTPEEHIQAQELLHIQAQELHKLE